VERQLIDEYVATGKVRFEYHHYIVVDSIVGGNESQRAAEASECANEQGEFWNYHKMLFANWNGEGEGAFVDRRLKVFAETLGLDTQKFNQCFDSGRYAGEVRADTRLGQSLGVTGTPTVFVNGQKVETSQLFSVIDALLPK
jgi:protein-disulfide isomerase